MTFIPGRTAKLTLFDDGVTGETIDLTTLKTKEEMHALMLSKGFEQLSSWERKQQEKDRTKLVQNLKAESIHKFRERRQEALLERIQRRDEKRRHKKALKKRASEDRRIVGEAPGMANMLQMYAGAGVVAVLFAAMTARRRKQRKSAPVFRSVGNLSS